MKEEILSLKKRRETVARNERAMLDERLKIDKELRQRLVEEIEKRELFAGDWVVDYYFVQHAVDHDGIMRSELKIRKNAQYEEVEEIFSLFREIIGHKRTTNYIYFNYNLEENTRNRDRIDCAEIQVKRDDDEDRLFGRSGITINLKLGSNQIKFFKKHKINITNKEKILEYIKVIDDKLEALRIFAEEDEK